MQAFTARMLTARPAESEHLERKSTTSHYLVNSNKFAKTGNLKEGGITFMDELLKENIYGALETVEDPELGVDIVNLGLVYDVQMDEQGNTVVSMTLTSMGCPLAGTIVDQVKAALYDIPEVKNVEVKIVWSPPWTKDKMSRMAKIALGIR
jgi:metal-sulfur cluster biosynthetic enzyme